MARSILAAVLGYIVMVIVVMAVIGIAWAILGGSVAFEGEGPNPSTAWLTFNIVSGFLAAAVGGCVALRIGKSALAVKILVGIVVLLGLYFALTAESSYADREQVDKPVAEMTFWEAGQHAKHPTWYNWTIPLVAVAGVLVGGRKWSTSGSAETEGA